MNKNIPKDIDNLSELPEESDDYKTLDGNNFSPTTQMIWLYS